jgi:L,D-transpeptidase catalytic domain
MPDRTSAQKRGTMSRGRSIVADQRAPRWLGVAILAALISAVMVAATAFAMNARRPSLRAAASTRRAVDAVQDAKSGRSAAVGQPFQVVSISPGDSADPVTRADPVRVTLSGTLAPGSPMPTFSPPIAGRWHVRRGTLVFVPAAPIGPATKLRLRVPASLRSATGARLTAPASAVFQAGGWSAIRLQRLLAELGYLPLSWARHPGSRGSFSWQGRYPIALTRQWRPRQPGVVRTAALMAFQSDHRLPMTGTADDALWRALFAAAARGRRNPHGYTYALVDKALPETLRIWHDGHLVMRALVNTGAAITPTADGTFPVYLRHRFQVMRGFMPDGRPYADPVHYVAFFNGGDAVHSFHRVRYGYPQSLGCVELPLAKARKAWALLSYGSLVTIAG